MLSLGGGAAAAGASSSSSSVVDSILIKWDSFNDFLQAPTLYLPSSFMGIVVVSIASGMGVDSALASSSTW
jgi:hypothetical protein